MKITQMTIVALGILIAACTTRQSEKSQSKETPKEYTVEYELTIAHPDTIDHKAEMVVQQRRTLYANRNFGTLHFYPGNEDLFPDDGKMKEYVYYDFKANTSTAVHYMLIWGDTLTTVEKFTDFELEATTETKKILGYQCTKAFWVYSEEYKIPFWYTKDLPIKGSPSVAGGNEGLVLDFGGYFKAVAIKEGIPEGIELKAPHKLGKIVSLEELMKAINIDSN